MNIGAQTMFKNMPILRKIITFIIVLQLTSCTGFFSKKEKDPDSVKVKEKERKSFSVKDRVNSSETGIIFGGKKKDKLGGQNIMWRATLNTLDFMPIASASYDGGLIITDWYSAENINESIKIKVSFNSNEINASSIQVSSFKKSCQNGLNCKVLKNNDDFNKKIKNQILNEVREINSQIKSQ